MCATKNSDFAEDEAHFTDMGFLSDRLLNALQTSVIIIESDGTIFRINKLARQDLHLVEDIKGINLFDLISIMYRNDNILPELISRFGNPETEQVLIPQDSLVGMRDDRIVFFASGSISRIDHGRFLFSFRNIADEMTQDYMIKMALGATKIFPWFYDFDRGTMIIDLRYFDYTGIPAKDYTMTLEAFSERIHPDDRSLMAHAFTLQLNGEHYPYPVPFRLRRGDERYEWFEGQSTYLGRVKTMPYRIVGICMSTQAHKDIEETLTIAKNKAEQSDKLKSAFLANMSHELRTPLNAIVGFSNLLTGGEVDINSEDAKEYTLLINKNCDHLLTLVSDVLDLSRIETGAMEYNFAELWFSKFISDIYYNHKYTIPQGVEFNLLQPREDVRIMTDSVRLRQVVGHLIGNAVKFTASGHIDLGYTLSSDGKDIQLFVADTGLGIASEQFEKIFERFYKVDSFMQGAGLGLSICKTITERLGGTISVSSYLKRGSCFTIKFPLKPKEKE